MRRAFAHLGLIPFLALTFWMTLTLLEGSEQTFSVLEEEVAVEQLIEATELRLQAQKTLLAMMEKFKLQKEQFFKGEQTRQHAVRMVRTAREILDVIAKERLRHLFSSDYLEELTFFSSIAGKHAPAPP